VEDLERKVGELAQRGLSVPEIADWLQVPAAEVRQVLDPEPDSEPETSGDESFPASDPPAAGRG
jgi:orotate phosphoribosyltransferase-like protein